MGASQPERPPTVRYRALLSELAKIDTHLENGGDKLQSAAAAVIAVNHFLSEDNFVKDSGVGKVLRLLSDQLGDAYAGSKQTMFIKTIAKGERPTLAIDTHRGMLVFALDILIKAGMKNVEAVGYLQKLIRDAGIKYRDKPISNALLLTWREQIGDTSPTAATEMMQGLAARIPVTINSTEEAKTVAKAFVEVIARRDSN